MRTMTAQQTRVMGLNARASFVDVQVFNALTSSWVSLKSLFGLDFITTVTWTDQIDNNGCTATITLDRNIYYYNLSSLTTTSRIYTTYGILIDLNIPIKVFAAVMPIGLQPNTSDYIEVFYGRIYQTDWATNTFTLQCRDWMDQLQSLWIESSSGIIPANPSPGDHGQTVMQGILNIVGAYTGANLILNTVYSVNGTSGTPFINGSSPDDPGWVILSTDPYPTSLMTVYTALDNLSQQIGWCLRQKWNNNIGAWALTWFDPLRGNTTPIWTYSAGQWLQVSTCGVHIGDIRNVVQVWYSSLTVAQAASGSNSTSITQYGRQFMQIGTDATLAITGVTLTSTGISDYQTMINGALSDLSQPLMDFVVDVPFAPFFELNDMILFKADGWHFSSDQTLAMIGFSHTIDKSTIGTTTLTTRGKPTAGIARWFGRQQQNFTKALGATNTNLLTEGTGNLTPNGTFGQFTRH
jgi:hypothetical protein